MMVYAFRQVLMPKEKKQQLNLLNSPHTGYLAWWMWCPIVGTVPLTLKILLLILFVPVSNYLKDFSSFYGQFAKLQSLLKADYMYDSTYNWKWQKQILFIAFIIIYIMWNCYKSHLDILK